MDNIFNGIKLIEQANTKKVKEDFKHNLTVVIGCALLMLMLVYLDDGIRFLLDYFHDLACEFIIQVKNVTFDEAAQIYEDFICSNTFNNILGLFTQLVMLLLPTLIAAKSIKNKPISFYPLKAVLPEKPWSFIGFSFGTCYMVNMLCNLLFNKFYPNIEALSYGEVAFSFLSIVIVAPIFEELVFRGVFFQALLPYNRTFAIVFSALIFGLMHRNPPSVINALVFGIFAAIGFAKTKSILICVVLHMTNNAISFMVAYLISNANMFAFAMLFSVFTIGTIGFAIAFLVNMLVSKRRSSISLSPQLS
ncbi:MAG: CPBP family intramembrane glutamic endopeptidase, partial [Clostridia bacterium]